MRDTRRKPMRRKETILTIGAVGAIGICTGSLLWPRGEAPVRVRPHEALGQVLAEEIATRLDGQGRLLILTSEAPPNSPVSIQTASFRKHCAQVGLAIAGVRTLSRYEQGTHDPQSGVPGPVLQGAIGESEDLDAIVSFSGCPVPSSEAVAEPVSVVPRFFAISRSADNLESLFAAGAIELVVLPRFAFPAPDSSRGTTEQNWFDRYYQIITGPDELPPGPHEMPGPDAL